MGVEIVIILVLRHHYDRWFVKVCDIEIIDERLRRYELEKDEPEPTKADIIQRQIDDWRYIDRLHPD